MTTRQAGGIALVLIVIATALMVVFQTIEMVEERSSLAQLYALQENALRQAMNQRHRFEALSSGLAELAAQGDEPARLVVEALRREGLVLPAKKP
jgi:hypothetical protein